MNATIPCDAIRLIKIAAKVERLGAELRRVQRRKADAFGYLGCAGSNGILGGAAVLRLQAREQELRESLRALDGDARDALGRDLPESGGPMLDECN